MRLASKPILLVGSFEGETANDALGALGPGLGDRVLGLTDGEIGIRRFWIHAPLVSAFIPHPDVMTVTKPKGIPGLPEWVPNGYGDLYKIGPRPGVKSIDIPTLGYAEAAIDSYKVFCRLRDAGKIAKSARFQVCLPFPEDFSRLFTTNADDMDVINDAYIRAMKRDLKAILAAIPANDLVLQWDVNWQVIAADAGDLMENMPPMHWRPHGDPISRYKDYLNELTPGLPDGVLMGLHLCYGDLHHKHFVDPKDLGVCVSLANIGVATSKHPVAYAHMPVPLDRADDTYFAPLRDLDLNGGTLYVGLTHYSDGVPGGLKRLAQVDRHFSGVAGISTECGLGRRPPEQDMKKMLQIHCDIVDSYGK